MKSNYLYDQNFRLEQGHATNLYTGNSELRNSKVHFYLLLSLYLSCHLAAKGYLIELIDRRGQKLGRKVELKILLPISFNYFTLYH